MSSGCLLAKDRNKPFFSLLCVPKKKDEKKRNVSILFPSALATQNVRGRLCKTRARLSVRRDMAGRNPGGVKSLETMDILHISSSSSACKGRQYIALR